MNINLELILVVGSLITGVIWLLYIWDKKTADATGFSKHALPFFLTGPIWPIYHFLTHKAREERKEPLIVEYARSFFPVLFVVLILRSFIIEPFRIPSGSMLPTLEIGDFILVNKFAYGIRLPVLKSKIIDIDEPKRGEVAVFRYPVDNKTDYIKRVIGLPGDRIQWINKQLYVNGQEVQHVPVGDYDALDRHNNVLPTLRLTETLGEFEHDIIVVRNHPGRSGEAIVPEGQYFVMGDNRDNSNDSRIWGFVPEENLVGKAMIVWMHLNIGGDGFKLDRIGNSAY
jgi:signal peptidase I